MEINGIVFDVYGTLLDVASVRQAATAVTAEPDALVELWRQKQLEYSWLHSLMGGHRDFSIVTGEALDYSLERLGIDIPPERRDRLVDAWLDVRPYPEVPGALRALAPRRLGVLSNGTPAMLDAGLSAAGLTAFFDPVMSVEEVGIFKPHPSVYALAEKHLGFPAERILFVSSNPWDVAGAKSFGLPVAWVNRTGTIPERVGPPPDFVVRDLAELADSISL